PPSAVISRAALALHAALPVCRRSRWSRASCCWSRSASTSTASGAVRRPCDGPPLACACEAAVSRTAGSQSSLREANRTLVIESGKEVGGLTQVELVDATGLAAAVAIDVNSKRRGPATV